MILVYVAGPYHGVDFNAIEANIRRAEAAAIELWDAGFGVVCPHLNTAHFEVKSTAPVEAYLEVDLRLLRACDALLLLEGWPDSKGSLQERDEAWVRGLPVFYSVAELKRVFHYCEQQAQHPNKQGGSGRPPCVLVPHYQ